MCSAPPIRRVTRPARRSFNRHSPDGWGRAEKDAPIWNFRHGRAFRGAEDCHVQSWCVAAARERACRGVNGRRSGLVRIMASRRSWNEQQPSVGTGGLIRARNPRKCTTRKTSFYLSKLDFGINLRAGTASGSVATLSRLLYRRAWRVTIRAEHAAIPRLGFEHRAAALAFIKELAGVRRHCFRRLMTTMRACDRGLELHRRGCAPYLTLAG